MIDMSINSCGVILGVCFTWTFQVYKQSPASPAMCRLKQMLNFKIKLGKKDKKAQTMTNFQPDQSARVV